MCSLNLKIAIITSFISIVVFPLKLFSVVLRLPDDPTNILALRASPSLINEMMLYDYLDLTNYFVITSDENGFFGKNLYFFSVDYLAYALVFFSISLWFTYIKNKK